MKKLFIITGEQSGDKHASDVVKEIRKLNPDIQIEGVGGQNLAELGVKLFCDHSKMSAVGFNTKIILTHIQLGQKVAKYIKEDYKPDMVLMVDYGGFNLNLSKVLSNNGIKLYYYIPPQIWASRKWRIHTVKKHIDKVLTIFPFEKKMYDEYGIDSQFVGHPLLTQIPPKADKNKFFEENNLDKNKKLISIFPGSRVFEINNLLKLFLDSARMIKQQEENVQFLIAQAPTIKDELLNTIMDQYKDLDIKVLKNRNYDLLAVSDALILASGTVALEAAIYETPMIISYRGPLYLFLVYRLVRCIKRVCLPNIIMDKDIVPEIIQYDAKPSVISSNILKIIKDENYRTEMINSLKNVKQMLNTSGSAYNVAQIVVNNI